MSLSSLIVQREVATMRQVEEALARQVIYGGDLVTNLLEVARVDEGVLVELLAESMRLAPAPSGELPMAPDRVKALMQREVAVARAVVPLDVQVDGKLVLAVAEPLSQDAEDQLRASLGMAIEQRAAPAVRVQQAIARAYGAPLDRRMLRLIARLTGGPQGASLPPPVEAPRAEGPRAEPPRESAPVEPEPSRTVSSLPPPRASATTVPDIPPAAAIPASVVGRLEPRAAGHRTTAAGFPAVRAPFESVPDVDVAPTDASAKASHDGPALPPPARVPAPAPATGLLQREGVTGARPARRRRGPITVEKAEHEAEEAEDRDTLLDLFFDFSQQFFDYSALFLVHGDIAEGRDAFGSGAHRERVLGIGVPLDMPSMMSTVREHRLPMVAKAPGDGLDAVLLADLHRGRESEVAVVPLVVRTRAVALLIGDCGEAGIERASIQNVVAFASVVGKAFERIIVRRKLSGFVVEASETRAGRPPSTTAAPAAKPRSSVSNTAPTGRFEAPIPSRRLPLSGPPIPLVSKRPKAIPPLTPATNESLPPPAANVASMRRITGPPIPREEPDAPAVARVELDTARKPASKAPSPLPAPTPLPSPASLSPLPSPASLSPRSLASPGAPAPTLEVIEHHDEFDADLDPDLDDDGEGADTLFEEVGWGPGDPPAVELLASAAVAVAPHLPPAPVPASVELPSVMVDDLDRELTSMVDRLASGEVDEVAEGELLRQGERAMHAIMSRFPGPIAFSRARIATALSPPRASECGPVLRLVARERRVALPFVLDRLTSSDVEIRGWATHLLCELPYVDAIPRLMPRLRDVDASTRVSAAHALVAIARTAPAQVRDALVGLAHGAQPEDRAAAMTVMAKLREASFVPELVHALGDDDDRVVAAAHDALVKVTRQDLGTDARPWLRWWEQNASKHRVEWLIDALAHDVAEIRKSAAEELRALTKEYFGYAGDLPPRDRDRAQQRYRDWWTMEGRSRFRHP